MSTEKKVLLAVSVVVGLLVVVLFSSEVIEKEIAPRPKAAWVAIEVGDSGIARTGPVEIGSGTSFRLHAVLEAETFTGDTIYYTEANQLEIQGVAIPSPALRVWNRSTEPRVLWFTVDGFKPYVELGSGFDLQDFRFQENFRADWPRTWSIPGDLRPRGERDMKSSPVEGLSRFGTQRYHVRVEIFGPKSEITPAIRLQSLKAEDLPERSGEFSTVRATLPDGLAVPTGVYGLSQIEAHSEVEDTVAEQLTEWFQGGLTFSRLRLLRETLQRAGTNYGDLQWSAVELSVDQVWGERGVGAGDLLRVGDRWVVILHDTAVEGLLDRSDLCLDFDKGARIRQIGEVFTGEGLVEWASLALQKDSIGE
jgi:hypothetical protein